MKFLPLPLPGACVIEPEMLCDQRGAFARTYCRRELAAQGIDFEIVQSNVSLNTHRGTVRGMHFQRFPKAEGKLIRCTRGAVHDVIVDLRPDSPAYCRWTSVELTADNHRILYVPPGLGHGFQTLTDDAELFYEMSEFYSAEHASGVRWNDPAFGILWPLEVTILSPKDQAYPDFQP